MIGIICALKEEIDDMCFQELYTRSQTVMRSLAASEVTGKILTSEELAENSSGGDYLKWSWYEFGYSADWKSFSINEKYTNYIIFDFDLTYFTIFHVNIKSSNSFSVGFLLVTTS